MVLTTGSIESANLGAHVAQRLREMILWRHLPDGARLLEEDLAARFELSRGPIRDAFRQLAREGLVRTTKRGVYVAALTAKDIGHLYDLRKALELLAVTEAVRSGPEQQPTTMAEAVAQMRDAARRDDHAAFARADVAFHSATFTMSSNRRLSDVWHQYEPIIVTILEANVGQDENLRRSADDHQLLLELITLADERALAEASDHIDRARDRMITSYERFLSDRPRTPA